MNQIELMKKLKQFPVNIPLHDKISHIYGLSTLRDTIDNYKKIKEIKRQNSFFYKLKKYFKLKK